MHVTGVSVRTSHTCECLDKGKHLPTYVSVCAVKSAMCCYGGICMYVCVCVCVCVLGGGVGSCMCGCKRWSVSVKLCDCNVVV